MILGSIRGAMCLTDRPMGSWQPAWLTLQPLAREHAGSVASMKSRCLLPQVLNALGQSPTDEDLFNMIREVDEDESGEIEIEEFMMVVQKTKEQEQKSDDGDLLAAFVAMGGNDDGSGSVSVEKLVNTLNDFELAIDLGRMLQEVDKDKSGAIDYGEFSMLLNKKS